MEDGGTPSTCSLSKHFQSQPNTEKFGHPILPTHVILGYLEKPLFTVMRMKTTDTPQKFVRMVNRQYSSLVSCGRTSPLKSSDYTTTTKYKIIYLVGANWTRARLSLYSTSHTIKGKRSRRPTGNWSSVSIISCEDGTVVMM